MLKLQLGAITVRCPCCGQMSVWRSKHHPAAAALFKIIEPYLVCPVCLQLVADPMIRGDQEYQRKARVELYEAYDVVVRTKWTPSNEPPPVEIDPLLAHTRKRDDDD